jgi:hypothetical protein
MSDLLAELEGEARRRYARWDNALWRRVLEGPARQLAAALRAAGTPEPATEALLDAYLRLAAEAIGLGYLFPPEVGEGFLNEAFFRAIPAGLAALPGERRAQALADCWNLGENLEHAPAWWRRMFLRLLGRDGASLASLRGLVERVEREALGEPAARLGERPRLVWIDLGAEDRRFLPGALHFVAPAVLCVHDRRGHAHAGATPSVGAWLADPPAVLGPMGCGEAPGPGSDRLDLVEEVAARDPRAGDALNSAANDWRAGLTLETSQFLLALYPA